MPARTTAILGATLAAAFATALPAPAADRPGNAGTDGPGAVLAGLLAQNSGGIFEATTMTAASSRRPASASSTPRTRSGTTAATRQISTAWSTPRPTATGSGCSPT